MTAPFRLLLDRLVQHVENIVALEEVDSTHLMAIRLIAQMEEEEQALPRTVLVADRQSAGTGRLGRRWISPAGGLYLNWLSAGIPNTVLPLMPILAAAASIQALDEAGVSGAAIKWPNDLLVSGCKTGGILVHGRLGSINWVTVGVGINLVQTPRLESNPHRPPTALRDHIDPFVFEQLRARLAGSLIGHLHAALAHPSSAVELWRERLIHRRGDPVTVQIDASHSVTGTFLGTGSDGRLVLDVEGAERVVSSGDIVSG